MERFFKLSENKTNISTEIIAGITTFVTMAYILFVNPTIMKQAGMNELGALGKDALAIGFEDPVVLAIFASTCLAAALGSLLMGVLANLPFGLAPGMGLNAFFSFGIVIGMGYTWQEALAAVFISGILFIILTITGLREGIVDAIPDSLKRAIGGGIGLFIAFIGLQNAGIIVSAPDVLVGFGDFTNKGTIVAVLGLIVTGVLMARGVKGSMLIGIVMATLIGIPMGVSNIPDTFTFGLPSLEPTFFKLDFVGLLRLGEVGLLGAIANVVTIVISLSLVDLFDSLGALIGTGAKAGFLDEQGRLKNMKKALFADSIATSIGALFGNCTTTTYVESASGVSEGGRTGLTAVVVSILFVLSLFFAPVIGIVPPQATAPALIIVGVLMMSPIMEIDFNDFTEALPAFLTMAIMPFSYSIANGIAAGLVFYPLMKIATKKYDEIHPGIYILAFLFIIKFTVLPH
ncbi:NCS2 family permease [Clostridium sp. D2Q-11]|uniref:NCS2 family permease n=1 Tax=Anaeromonas frigoriresistens TaxID=2683708 RepID=A0A942UWE1_9FIRM|nr:NCS2 family permease [Anaeromonas frigoriresistens]MBS4538054.1 NCS2 family permease [Anaeromonas frigoriresistens]